MKLSVITLTRNNFNELWNTYCSLLKLNSYDLTWELIIVNGGKPIDNKNLFSEGSVIFKEDGDSGIYDAMNQGLSIASGEFCWFLNSGDKCVEFGEILPYLNKDNDYVYGNTMLERSGKTINVRRSKPSWYNILNMHANHQSIFFRKELLDKHMIRYDISYKIAGDFKFILDFLQLEQIKKVHVDVVVNTFDLGGISNINSSLGRNEQFRVRRYRYGLIIAVIVKYLQKFKHDRNSSISSGS